MAEIIEFAGIHSEWLNLQNIWSSGALRAEREPTLGKDVG